MKNLYKALPPPTVCVVYVCDDPLPVSGYCSESNQVAYVQWRLLRYAGRNGGKEDWQRMAVKVTNNHAKENQNKFFSPLF